MSRTFNFNQDGIESVNGVPVPKGQDQVACIKGYETTLHEGPKSDSTADPTPSPDNNPDFSL